MIVLWLQILIVGVMSEVVMASIYDDRNAGLTEMPGDIPIATTEIYLDDNQIR